MAGPVIHPGLSRRRFLKSALAGGSFLCLKGLGAAAPSRRDQETSRSPEVKYKFRTMSVAHYPELQEDIDRLRRENKLSTNSTYRSYIDRMKFQLPKNFPDAKSVVVLAFFTKLMKVNFQYKGRSHPVVISPQYYDDGISREDLIAIVRSEIIKDDGPRVEPAFGLHLKRMSVRSGLGRYGRNNLCFVDGFGTYITLYAFHTDFRFPDDHWGEAAMMEACRDCSICYGICPSGAIRRENFVIDAAKCITLYNEIEGDFPNWALPGMHNALMGCMKCQARCPENEKIRDSAGSLEDVTEEETEKILAGKPDDALLESLTRKLKGFPPATSREQFPIFTRNLGALIRQA